MKNKKIVDIHFPTLISTNTWAKENLETFSDESLLVITADVQTGGRGRFGKAWFSNPFENLLVSFAFLMGDVEIDPLLLTTSLAKATLRVLEKFDVHGRIKPPNDIFVGDKKIAGILCETFPCKNQKGIVIGMGLNVNMEAATLEKVGQPATSLFLETKEKKEIGEILKELKKEFLGNVGDYY